MKKLILFSLFSLVGFSSTAFAQNVPNSNATQFAVQAGAIAGSAQACGQDISVLNRRVVDVVNVLTTVPADQQTAMMVYEKILASSQLNQIKNKPIQCSEVLQAYNSLPLLKPDYKTTVLPQMAKMANSTGTPNAS